jgi:hypothetical protein
MKKSSIIHHDLIAVVNDMPDEMAGKFVKLLSKVMRGESYVVTDFALKMAIHPFLAQFKRDEEKYDSICERNRKNGEKGGRPRKNPKNPDGLNKTQRNPEKPKKPDNDNGSDNGSDNDNKNDSDNKDNNTVENQKIFNGSVADIFNFWKETLNHPRAKLDDKRKKKIKAILDLGYTEHDIKTAIMGCAISPHHQGQNDRKTKYDDIELICRDAKHIDSFSKIASEKNIRNALTSKGMRNKAVLESWLEDAG